MRRWKRAFFALVVICAPASSALAQNVDAVEHVLENGMTFLFVKRPGEPNISAGWIAKVGSVNERPGITGIAHLFEHMMFKGTRTIGTKDIARDLEIMAELDSVRSELRALQLDLERRARVGEISDTRDPAFRSKRHQELLDRFSELLEEQRAVIVKDEFDRIYSAAGASGMNAGTTYDFTIYFISVPRNKLELWCWMESDRLLQPVFREFYSERDVVREERRLRTESTPIGRFEEQFEAMFWSASPYSWPVIGWPSDVESITREEANAFYDLHYAPGNLAACLVGDFEIEEAKALVERYFGRLPRAERLPDPVITREVEPLAEKRMIAHAPTNPRVTLRYHTIPDGHADEPAFLILDRVLKGPTGRLHKRLVLEKQVATSANASHEGRKYEGFFEFTGVAKPDGSPEIVEKEIEAVIEELKEDLIGERELQKVKNQLAAVEFRKLRSSFTLMLELLIRETYRGWETINTDPALVQAVTAEDVRDVVRRYFSPERRSVITYYTKGGEGGDAASDPILAGLSDEERAQAEAFRAQIRGLAREEIEAFLSRLPPDDAVPEERRAMLSAVRKIAQARLAEMAPEGEGGDEASPSPEATEAPNANEEESAGQGAEGGRS